MAVSKRLPKADLGRSWKKRGRDRWSTGIPPLALRSVGRTEFLRSFPGIWSPVPSMKIVRLLQGLDKLLIAILLNESALNDAVPNGAK